jgi:uncharacterized membrane protein
MEAFFFLVVVPFWLFLCHIAGTIAANKGRDYWAFCMLALVFSPLVGLIAVAVAKSGEQIAAGAKSGRWRSYRKCPSCAKGVKIEAFVCWHCHNELPTLEEALAAAPGDLPDLPPG